MIHLCYSGLCCSGIQNWASAISMPLSMHITDRLTSAFALLHLTSISRPPTRCKARWKTRRPLWRRPAASIPNLPSNGCNRSLRTSRICSKEPERPDCRKTWLNSRISPSWCYPSQISPAIPPKIISRTASPRTLTTDLSRIHNSFVIARNTAFTYKGKNLDAKEIGKELGVRYVLEGSVQRDQNRVRVNAQLIDAESGAHLWAERFEEDVADLFKLQDQVVARLGNALGFELVKAEAEKSARSKNPDAVDLAMRGWAMMWQSYPQPMKEKEASHNAALALFDQALKIDPNDADALAGDAFTYMAIYVYGWATTEKDFDAKIIDQADRAIALAPDNMRAYAAKSFYLAVSHRADDALRAADAGLAIDPNYAPLLDARANAETALGRFEQAKSDAEQAMRLSPRDPEMANRLMNLGMAELGLGHFDAAIVEFQKAIDAGDRSFIPHALLTAAYSLEGKTEEAKSALAEGRRLNPKLTIKWLTDHAPNIPPLFEGLRKAGLAEQ